MQAMADPKKTAAVYFAMVEARPIDDGRLSDRDLVEAEELCRALGQEGLTEEERYAVAHLALPHGRTKTGHGLMSAVPRGCSSNPVNPQHHAFNGLPPQLPFSEKSSFRWPNSPN